MFPEGYNKRQLEEENQDNTADTAAGHDAK
jgi:hypothetical protein